MTTMAKVRLEVDAAMVKQSDKNHTKTPSI